MNASGLVRKRALDNKLRSCNLYNLIIVDIWHVKKTHVLDEVWVVLGTNVKFYARKNDLDSQK